MPKHEFGILPENPVAQKRFDGYEPKKYNCISVDDDLIEPLLEKLANVDFYWHTLTVPVKGLAYWGITLIPPSSMDPFIKIFGDDLALDELKKLLVEARTQKKFIIHFGI